MSFKIRKVDCVWGNIIGLWEKQCKNGGKCGTYNLKNDHVPLVKSYKEEKKIESGISRHF